MECTNIEDWYKMHTANIVRVNNPESEALETMRTATRRSSTIFDYYA